MWLWDAQRGGEGGKGGGEGGDHCLLLPYILFKWIPDHLAAHCDTSCKDATPIAVQPTTFCLCWTTFQKCRENCSHKLSCKLFNYTTCQGQAFFQIWTSDMSFSSEYSLTNATMYGIAKLACNTHANGNVAQICQRRATHAFKRRNPVTHKRKTVRRNLRKPAAKLYRLTPRLQPSSVWSTGHCPAP